MSRRDDGADPRRSQPELLAERIGHHARDAQAVRAHEQVRDVEQRKVDGVEELAEVLGPRTPERRPRAGRRRAPRWFRRRARAESALTTSGSRSASNVASSACVNSSGSTRFTMTVPSGTVHLGPQRVDELDRLRDRHLLGRRDDVHRGDRGIGEQLARATGSGCARDRRRRARGSPSGAPNWATMWPVAAASTTTRSMSERPFDRFPNLPADLADGEDLLHARRRVGDEVERLGERTDPAEHRHPQVELAGTPATTPRCPSPSRARRDGSRAA